MVVKLSLAELTTLRASSPEFVGEGTNASLAERFVVPPFSVLDTRSGKWQDRKRYWLELGLDSEVDHGERLLEYSERISTKYIKGNNGAKTTEDMMTFSRGKPQTDVVYQAVKKIRGTSMFDPVLCEVMYKWFSPRGGKVLDPFAGGDMQGLVAGLLGRSYRGADLREKQVETNRARKAKVCPDADVQWSVGDSSAIESMLPGEYDFILSNPPYHDLEVYSDDPRDLSNMDYPTFLRTYKAIVKSCCSMLKQDRFAFFLVSDVRDKKTGAYRNLVGHTVEAFQDAGLVLYNEAVLVNQVGTNCLRVGPQFTGSRKLGKCHQNAIVFLKGDVRRASHACGEVDLDVTEMPEPVEGGLCICVRDCRERANQLFSPEELEYEVVLIDSPQLEAAILADVVRGELYRDGLPVARVWVGRGGSWVRLSERVKLTYLAGGEAYLNPEVFGDRVRRPCNLTWSPKRVS